ncbi:MAG TPA: DUF427 domain-containing protein [Stellaceae bacterium]|nr:DUF427 domain-containing protein [Stellaceae bacterium]
MPQPVGYPIAADASPIAVVPCAKRVRVVINGCTVADSSAPMILLERSRLPIYYFPRADIRTDLVVPSPRRQSHPLLGEAAFWTLNAGDRRCADALWSHDAPGRAGAALAGALAFDPAQVDHWYEEDEEVFGHARDPYHRIDVRASARRVRIEAAGIRLAETRRALFLFETGLPTRHYIRRADVRMELLARSPRRTVCPYKGFASYFTLRAGGETVPDAAWSYENPLPECPRIESYLCFYPDKVAVDVEAAGRS